MRKFRAKVWLHFIPHVLDQLLTMLSRCSYHALPQYLQNDLKRSEKRAMAMIMPTESYSNTLDILGIPSLKDHHEQLCA